MLRWWLQDHYPEINEKLMEYARLRKDALDHLQGGGNVSELGLAAITEQDEVRQRPPRMQQRLTDLSSIS